MAYYIGETCIKCGSCREECPGNAIKKKDEVYYIELDKCLECGTCSFVCPVGAVDIKKRGGL